MDLMRISGTELSSVILSATNQPKYNLNLFFEGIHEYIAST